MALVRNGVFFAAFVGLSRADFATVECEDVAEDTPGTCAGNVTWAMMTGIKDRVEDYNMYPELKNSSTRADFQCVLNMMATDQVMGNGHDCPFPCSSTLSYCATVVTSTAPVTVVETDTNDTVTTVPPTPSPPVEATSEGGGSGSGSLQWWGYCLIIGPLLCCIGGLLYFLLVAPKKEAPKKKKRAVKSVPVTQPLPPAEETRTMAVPYAPVTTAMPQYVQATAVPTTAVPMQMAAPVQYAAPVYSMAQPAPAMAYPAAPATYAAPAPYAAPQMSAFNMLDANHDGVITRAEFARLGM